MLKRFLGTDHVSGFGFVGLLVACRAWGFRDLGLSRGCVCHKRVVPPGEGLRAGSFEGFGSARCAVKS